MTEPAAISINGTPTPASALPPGFRNPHDKKGRSTSCLLCQKRKQKCDHRLPSCTTCIKAGVECIQPAKYAVKAPDKDEYTLMLEKKVRYLEKVLDSNNISINTGENATKKNFKYKKLSPFLSQDNDDTTKSSNIQVKLEKAPLVPLVDNKIIPLPANRKLPIFSEDLRNKKNYLSIDSIDYSNSIFAKYNLKEFLKFDPVFEFDEKLSRAFLDIHFTRLQFKYPLLSEEEIFAFHNAYVTNNLSGYMNNNDYFHYCSGRMWMIFAISACLQKATGRYNGAPPARYFSTAIRHITKAKTISKIHQIEILTLAVLYLIRTDRDSVCLYDLITDSLRICLELGLNKTKTYENIPEDEKLRFMRLWWCVYLLERMITIAVGKPYSLDESLVDDDLPLFQSEPSKAKHPSNITFINQSIKLRRIESRFVCELNINSGNNNLNNMSSDQLPLVEKYFQELEVWRGNCEGFSNGIENETLRLYYYRSVRLLIQPFLELMDPMDKLFRECQAAAGQICQLFKVFHEKTVFGHSTTAIHTVFAAGVTLIYCLWLTRNKDDMKRRAIGDSSKHTRPQVSESLFLGLNDLRACSICLYVMTERSKFALIFRDTFDQIMGATIANYCARCGPDSSEIIYPSVEPGMPPAIVRRYNTKGFLVDDAQKTDEEKIEQAERRRKQGQLQKNVVPKSLSHLLADSPPLRPEEKHHQEAQVEPQIPQQKPQPQVTQQPALKKPKLEDSFQYPTISEPSQPTQPTAASSASTVSTQSPQNLPTFDNEMTPFNVRTNTMINNISVWTGESGTGIAGLSGLALLNTASLFDHSIKPQNPQRQNQLQQQQQRPGDNYLFNVPADDFWTNNEDNYGFLS